MNSTTVTPENKPPGQPPELETAAHHWYAGEFETSINHRGNFITRLWGGTRGRIDALREQAGIKSHFRQLQKEWLGDLTGLRVLDVGCGAGNSISYHMAATAREYVAFDLSEPAIAKLRKKLDTRGLSHATTHAGDFLSDSFPFAPFDVVYANSLIHHFRPLEKVLEPLYHRSTPGARIVTLDPMATSLPVKIARGLVRPFRTDAAWNWPFTRESLQKIEHYFEIEKVQGFFGRSKSSIPLALIPGCWNLGVKLARKWHDRDIQEASRVGPGLWKCMSVIMLLRRLPNL